MTVSWSWVLLACAVAYLTKAVGYGVPQRWLRSTSALRLAGAVTVGLLAALVTLNTFADGQHLVVDARLVALVVAGVALWRRAPFIVVVVLGGAAAALTRLAGWG